uniref:Uncharacterized protein n=1 Tax=Kalanchoe fedtschenkoi TaxID=63787 RepID=A0A7N0V958_KALFE
MFFTKSDAIADWFLSSDAPFDRKGFSIVCASLFIIISLCCAACTLKSENPAISKPEDKSGNVESPLLV